MKRGSWYQPYGSCFLAFISLVLFSLSLFAYAQDSEVVEDPARGGVENPGLRSALRPETQY